MQSFLTKQDVNKAVFILCIATPRFTLFGQTFLCMTHFLPRANLSSLMVQCLPTFLKVQGSISGQEQLTDF